MFSRFVRQGNLTDPDTVSFQKAVSRFPRAPRTQAQQLKMMLRKNGINQ
jgi:hypothetical protein